MSNPERADAPNEASTRALPRPPGGQAAFAGLSSRRWNAIALLVFGLATLFLLRGLIGADWREVVPANIEAAAGDGPSQTNWDALAETDLRFVVWMVARGAHALVHHPGSYFDAEQCYPAERSLAFGESGIAMALVALPFWTISGDPLVTFDALVAALALIAAFAMYWLVRDWSACPPAGIAAGLLYSFHIMKIGDLTHVMIWDTSWTVLALYFATRLFSAGRWRDAVGLSAAIAVQTAGSVYPLLGAALIAVPFSIWLGASLGFSRIRPAQIGAIFVTTCVVASLTLGPYLQKSEVGELDQVPYLAFFSLAYFMPDGAAFAGWVFLALAIAGLALGRRRTVSALAADPRWAVLAAGALVFSICVVAAGESGQRTASVVRGEGAPAGPINLFLILADWLPMLESVRGPGALYGGVHLAGAILAGLGVAGLLRLLPERRRLAGAALLIALVGADALRPRVLGLEPAFDYTLVALRPADDVLSLFELLERQGDVGPVLEYPVNHLNMKKSSAGLLATAYHHRRTSYCYNSFLPAASREVERISARLPEDAALDELRALGFRTLVVHHAADEVAAALHRRKIERLAERHDPPRLERMAGNTSVTAWRIVAP